MAIQRAGEQAIVQTVDAPTDASRDAAKPEFPVREYIGAMALELAQMARWDGDEVLGRLLDSAATLAAQPVEHEPIEIVAPTQPRPS